MRNINFIYYDSSVELRNPYVELTGDVFYRNMNVAFVETSPVYLKTKGYSIAFYICTKIGNQYLRVLGPSRSKKYEVLDYSIFLPEQISSIEEYLNFVFEGIFTVMKKYGIELEELLRVENSCRLELGLPLRAKH